MTQSRNWLSNTAYIFKTVDSTRMLKNVNR